MASKVRLSRDQAMEAKPLATVAGREPLADGGVRVTVRYKPSRFQRVVLRSPPEMTRQFDLDAVGVEVLAMCDGQKTVRHIADAFARRHKVHAHEAQRAVATFLHTMIRKGLVVIAIPRGAAEKGKPRRR